MSEQETRKQLLGWARKYGAEQQLLAIFNRYDDLLKGAKTPEERESISVMANVEVYQFFGGNGYLEVNGKTILEDPDYEAQQKRLNEEELRKAANTRKF